jgi:hypothetical protein
MNLQLKRADKLKRDYIIYYTYECYTKDEDEIKDLQRRGVWVSDTKDENGWMTYESKEVSLVIKQCYNEQEARDRLYDNDHDEILEGYLLDFRVEQLNSIKEQRIKDEVYELVIADLFEGEIGLYEWIDIEDEDYEDLVEVDGVYKILIEHEAYNRYMNTRINNQ